MRVELLSGPCAGAKCTLSAYAHPFPTRTPAAAVAAAEAAREAAREAAAVAAAGGGAGFDPEHQSDESWSSFFSIKLGSDHGWHEGTYARQELKDLGGTTFLPATVVNVVDSGGDTGSGGNSHGGSDCDGGGTGASVGGGGGMGEEAFSNTLGCVRLDGPNSADRRSELLETFRTDPETPVALMSAETW
jgi:hypothetical protein